MSSLVTVDQVNAELDAALDPTQGETMIRAATDRVNQLIGEADVPAPIRRDAILAVIGDEWALRQAPNGIRAFAGADGGVIRVSLDTSRRARVLLRPWLGLGIG